MRIISKLLIPVFIGAFIQVAYAQTFMTEEELMGTIPGATIAALSTKDNKTPWQQTYSLPKKGKTKGKINGWWENEKGTYKASWKIKKGKWCESWKGGKACWDVERIDDSTIQMYKKGEKLSQVWNIIEPAP